MKKIKPSLNEYFMSFAVNAASRSVCLGRKVGAVIVIDNHIISTGYNGTPEGFADCQDGGCYRCDLIYNKQNTTRVNSGFGYDICTCCHAEENCITQAAKFGHSIKNGSIYTTLSPCFLCTRMLLQAGVKHVFYREKWKHPDPHIEEQLSKLSGLFETYQEWRIE